MSNSKSTGGGVGFCGLLAVAFPMPDRKLRFGWIVKLFAFALGVALMPVLMIAWTCLLGVLAAVGVVAAVATPVLAVIKADEMITIKVSSGDVEPRQENQI